MNIRYQQDLTGVDWADMKAVLLADDFDNGRTPAQYALSFANSAQVCLAYAGDQLVGTARALSDGVCNAYIVDVWTHSAYRRQGIATHMMQLILATLPGQHVYLFTDDAIEFYHQLGFLEQGVGLALVVGRWLDNTPRPG